MNSFAIAGRVGPGHEDIEATTVETGEAGKDVQEVDGEGISADGKRHKGAEGATTSEAMTKAERTRTVNDTASLPGGPRDICIHLELNRDHGAAFAVYLGDDRGGPMRLDIDDALEIAAYVMSKLGRAGRAYEKAHPRNV